MRKKEYERFALRSPRERFVTRGFPSAQIQSDNVGAEEKTGWLTGIGCSSGIVEGEAVIVEDPRRTNGTSGKILVARSTDPGWVFLMLSSNGIIVEKGSVLSHT